MTSFWLHHKLVACGAEELHGEITKIVQKATANSNDESACESDETAPVQLSNSGSDKEDTVVFGVNMFRIKMNRLRKVPMVVVTNTNKT